MKINSITVEGTFIKVKHGKNVKYANCVCECGVKFESFLGHVKDGHTKSCGCRRISSAKKSFTTHGYTVGKNLHPTYKTWRGIRNRCLVTTNPKFSRYGGRGIKICKRWMDFKNFLADMGVKPTPQHSIERINNNGNYSPKNCKWATTAEQSRNRRSNIWLEFKGEKMICADWAKRVGINYATLKYRIKAGWSAEKVLCTPLRVW